MARPVYCLALLAALASCESDLDLQPGVVVWMEWPAEVKAATPFAVRLVLPFPACHQWTFRPGVSADESAVTFAPFFLVKKGPAVCPPLPADLSSSPLPYLALDTSSDAPALAATSARTFEMRGSATVSAPAPSPSNGFPVRTFGDVRVVLSAPDTSRRNAAGTVTLSIAQGGCALVRPVGTFIPSFVLEDQTDTTGLTYAFVRGYIHDALAPVCGQTRVFHLESRN